MTPFPTMLPSTLSAGSLPSSASSHLVAAEIGDEYPSSLYDPLHEARTEPVLHSAEPHLGPHEGKRKLEPTVEEEESPCSSPSKKRRTACTNDTEATITVPPGTELLATYEEQDVLSGRGGGTNNHPGNRHFRDLIQLNRKKYLMTRKNDKPSISRAIVKAVRDAGGRFLKKHQNQWIEIGDSAAREKTSQALRQRAPEIRQLLFESSSSASVSTCTTTNDAMWRPSHFLPSLHPIG